MLSKALALLGVLFHVASACRMVDVKSTHLGSIRFHQIPLRADEQGNVHAEDQTPTGRAAFVSEGLHDEEGNPMDPLYLYHAIPSDSSGTGRWVINRDLGDNDAAMVYVDSWSIAPYLVNAVADTEVMWQMPNPDPEAGEDMAWIPDDSLIVECSEDEQDYSIYFDSSTTVNPYLTGFYVERLYEMGGNLSESILYSQIKQNVNDPQMFLFKLDNKWMISDHVGVDSGFAFIEDPANSTTTFPHEIVEREWRFISNSENRTSETDYTWEFSEAFVYSHHGSDTDHGNVYAALRWVRSIKFLPPNQKYLTLRNDIPMPAIGLGTGGLSREETPHIISEAMKMGYRLFDLAREYGNEHIVADIMAQPKPEVEEGKEPVLPYREDIFLESKVWPTHLGFHPTSDEIEASLEALKTNYVDLYLLHWPECDKTIEWMHCETTVDPEGTWKESWKALEKAYAEGRVMSIGVSNFDVNLLDELVSIASVRPHVVQNWAEPGKPDKDVREWCKIHGTVYQPYASLRNLGDIAEDTKESLKRIADEKNTSVHNVALAFFAQTGSGVIPRSSNLAHLQENLNAFSLELSEEQMVELGWLEDGNFEEEL